MSSVRPGDEVIVTLDRDQGHLPCLTIFVAEEAPNSIAIVAGEACPEPGAIELRACHAEGIRCVIVASVATTGLEARQLPAVPGTVGLISPNLKDVLRIYHQDQGNTSDLFAATARSAATTRSTPQPNGAAPAVTSSSARASPTSLTQKATGLNELARNMMRELQDMKAEMTRIQARTLAAHSASRSPDRWTAERPPWNAPPGRTTRNVVLGTGTGGRGNVNDSRRRTWIHDGEYDEEESNADDQPRFPRQTTGPPRAASSWEAAGHRGHSAGPSPDRDRLATGPPSSSQDAVNLEMLKTLRSMRKRRGSFGSSGSDHSAQREKVHRYQKEPCLSISRAISEQNGDDDQASPKGGGVGKGKRKTKATANGAAIATGAVDPA